MTTTSETMTRVVALVPAYNEQEGIAATIESLLGQQMPAGIELSEIIVVPNNCTDQTAAIARSYPVTVLNMEDNPHMKAGAMNAGWQEYCQDADFVFTMDADTVLLPDTLAGLLNDLLDRDDLGAVCARYWAQESNSLARKLQRLEYARYDDTREIRGWKVQVASGAAVMYRNAALMVAREKHNRPGPWDNESLIEDYGLTLDIKGLGYQVGASSTAHAYTDTPESFRELWKQRMRWGRGGIDECRKRGWTKETRRDIVSYYVFGVSMILRALWVTLVTMMVLYSIPYQVTILGGVVVAIMWTDRVTSVRTLKGKTWRDRLISSTLVLEDLYGFFLEACALASMVKSVRRTSQSW